MSDSTLTPEELEARKEALGSSDMGDLLELPPYGCRRRLLFDKGRIPTDFPQLKTGYQAAGNLLEDVVAGLYADATGYKVRNVKDMDGIGNENGRTLRREHPWWKSSIDRSIHLPAESPVLEMGGEQFTGPGIGEMKTGGRTKARVVARQGVAEDTEQEPWYAQVQHQLGHTGWLWAEIAFLNRVDFVARASDLPRHFVARDEDYIALIEGRGDELWGHVQLVRAAPDHEIWNSPEYAKKDPKSDACKDCAWRVSCHGDDIDAGKELEPGMGQFGSDPRWCGLAAEYRDWHEQDQELKAEKARIVDELKALVGDREGAEGGGLRVYFKEVKGG
ncbi:MAG: YqaJ viral recombinase family protein, partial [Gammaproteobacteria bacterium]|nr:YqaJ viral recombinase family protein [Gammaproteobacteria bacterium]